MEKKEIFFITSELYPYHKVGGMGMCIKNWLDVMKPYWDITVFMFSTENKSSMELIKYNTKDKIYELQFNTHNTYYNNPEISMKHFINGQRNMACAINNLYIGKKKPYAVITNDATTILVSYFLQIDCGWPTGNTNITTRYLHIFHQYEKLYRSLYDTEFSINLDTSHCATDKTIFDNIKYNHIDPTEISKPYINRFATVSHSYVQTLKLYGFDNVYPVRLALKDRQVPYLHRVIAKKIVVNKYFPNYSYTDITNVFLTVFIGRRDGIKGIIELWKSASIFLVKNPNVLLLVCSPKWNINDKWGDEKENPLFKLTNYYSFNTYQNENVLDPIRNAADVAFIPSKKEPCGLVLDEFFRAAVPVIVNPIDGLSDTTKDGYNCFFLNDVSEKSITNSLNISYNLYKKNPLQYNKMRDNCRRSLTSIDEMIKQLRMFSEFDLSNPTNTISIEHYSSSTISNNNCNNNRIIMIIIITIIIMLFISSCVILYKCLHHNQESN